MLVLDGLGLLWNVFLRSASTVGLALAGALTGTTSWTSLVVHLVEVGELRGGLVHHLLFTPGVEIIMREEPVEFIAFVSGLNKVGGIHNVLARVNSALAIGTALFNVASKSTRIFLYFRSGNWVRLGGDAFLQKDGVAHG